VRHAFEPAYLSSIHTGELRDRVERAYQRLSHCDFCAWECKVDRRAGVMGVCRTGEQARLSSYGPHRGEEAPLSGWRGSGTIFFARCNLRCQYCQNHDISQTDDGKLVEPEELAAVMLDLQDTGCHNINLVSPTHVVAPILAAVLIAAQAGLRLPLVYNTGGYDSISALILLEGVIDIYMPDMKYSSPQSAWAYSKARAYPQVNRAAVKEMHRQVGDLVIDERGLAQRGLLVRHLVLPNGLAGTPEVVRFLAEEVSPNTYLNLMDQYHPEYNVRRYRAQYPRLARPITPKEFTEAVRQTQAAGLHRLDQV
jgi:putative pyruvate formate lyase activating enzyme